MQACRHASMHPILDARAPTRGLDTHHHVPRPPPPPTRAPPPWTSRAPSFVPSPPRVRPRLSSHASIHSFIPSIHPSTHPRETSRPARTLSRPSRCRPLRKKDKRWSSHTLDYERESPSKHHDMSRTFVRTSSMYDTQTKPKPSRAPSPWSSRDLDRMIARRVCGDTSMSRDS